MHLQIILDFGVQFDLYKENFCSKRQSIPVSKTYDKRFGIWKYAETE